MIARCERVRGEVVVENRGRREGGRKDFFTIMIARSERGEKKVALTEAVKAVIFY